MFDDIFYDAESISNIVFPDTPDDIEKTILRITRRGIDEIKKMINEGQESSKGVDTPTSMKGVFKTFGNTFGKVWSGNSNINKEDLSDARNLAETCIEKSTEGIRKLRRFEGPTIKMMVEDTTETLDDLKNKWLPKLNEIKIR
jgi:hypothetical protein